MNIFVALVAFALICLIYGKLLEKRGLKGLACSRRFSKSAVFEGEQAELIEVISNDRPLFIPWLRVESRVTRYIQMGSRAAAPDEQSVPHQSLFTLMPFQRVTRRHQVTFLHRGEFDIGSASLTVGDITGMFQCSRDQRLSAPVRVYPRLLDDDEIPSPLSRLIGEATAQRQLLRDPFLIQSIRPWLPGDSARDIHWPATARTGEVQVRVHDWSAQLRLMIILNSQLRENQWGDLMEYEQEIIEREISLAATLCVRALRQGCTVGFAANMPMDDSREGAVLMPSGGLPREEALLTAFAKLKVLRTFRFPAFLDTLDQLTGLNIIVLSPYDSDEIRLRLNRLRRQGNTVEMVVLETHTEEASRRGDASA